MDAHAAGEADLLRCAVLGGYRQGVGAADELGDEHVAGIVVEGSGEDVLGGVSEGRAAVALGGVLAAGDLQVGDGLIGDGADSSGEQKSNAQSWLETQGANQISLTRLTLEDLFVALDKDEEAK